MSWHFWVIDVLAFITYLLPHKPEKSQGMPFPQRSPQWLFTNAA